MDDETKDWLLLMQLPVTIGARLLRLIDACGSPCGILQMDAREMERAGLGQEAMRRLHHPDWKSIEKDIEWLEDPSHHFISCIDERYPGLLKEIPDPPPGLFVKGKPEVLNSMQLGIVGSRNPSPAGKENARLFAGKMAQLGITVTSGLASGIDYCAHVGALDRNGATIAVLGNGLDQVYPRHHAELAERIADNGALVSEFVTGTPPVAGNFPRRNRIISGLSAGVLVVEAAEKSGSLITAHHALEQGREVFAIPGSIHNPLARGCHALIKQGAKLIESCADILEELNLIVRNTAASPCKIVPELSCQTNDDHMFLLKHITYDPVSIDRLVESSGLTVAVVSSMLLTMELRGVIAQTAGGCYARIK
jgi:DNA processing protein